MSGKRLRLSIPHKLAPFLEELLLLSGYDRLSLEQQTDSTILLTVYPNDSGRLPEGKDFDAWQEATGTELWPDGACRCRIESFDDSEDWTRPFFEHFAAREVLSGLEILPSWEKRGQAHSRSDPLPGPDTPLAIVIEPGMAFGTGDHPTTIACLDALRDLFRREGGSIQSVLDIGFGTGILAIAARLWGAGTVAGYDPQPDCVVNAWLNADLNGLAGEIDFRYGVMEREYPQGWDLIVCNLYLEPILGLLPLMDSALSPCGQVILSGILPDQGEQLQQAVGKLGWEPIEESEHEGWLRQQWQRADCG